MRLKALLSGVATPGEDPEIAEVRDDSRAVQAGDLFVAVHGQTVDGHDYLEDAGKQGAAAALVEIPVARETFGGVQVIVPSTQRALGRVAANRYGRPGDAMTLVGITGTNGKTTTTFLAEALATAAGGVPGVLGTVTYRYPGVSRPAPFTTPTPLELHATLAAMRDAGCTHVAMECSSHALALDRLEGLRFRVAAFTNLTQDHLDFHGTMEAYRDAKAKLFAEHLADDGVGVVLIDHPYGGVMGRAAGTRALTVSTREELPADVWLHHWTQDIGGIVAEFETPRGTVALRSPLIGRFNLENLAVAVGIGVGLGMDPPAIISALGAVNGVPGRVERVPAADARGFGVFVDYAHTPDALERVMAALRPLTRGRLIVVFGCGGARDRTKRPLMGRAVARDADVAIVTSDNPRTEEPRSILEMILEGVKAEPSPALEAPELASAPRGWWAAVDRREAIAAAMSAAKKGDVVLIAGKGHEDYQILGKTKHPFDDRIEAANALGEASGASRGASEEAPPPRTPE
jgi:UDP-N-acetylmuramoyl-L-alanyl-D-glutamate--2,6-diaminopimelate ligase